jgi:SAM-dependent methyltransferase
MLRDDIRAYYARGGERDRLRDGLGRLEFLRTWDILERELPDAPAQLLDVGGATGVYAGPLAEAGYDVRLIDPIPEQVAVAATLVGVRAEVGDVRDLPVRDASVDAVLLLGPLYHLLDRADRVRAFREAHRVVRPGGAIIAATINRYASLFDAFAKGYSTDPEFMAILDRTMATGRHRGTADGRYFTSAYFHEPMEAAEEAREAGLTVVKVVAVESPLWMSGAQIVATLDDPAQVSHLIRLLREVEQEPTLLGASSHVITVARRP